MNFDYLKKIPEMNDLYLACRDAERFALSEPVISATAARRAVEYLVKLIYSSVVTPYIDGMRIYDMITDQVFVRSIDDKTLIDKIHIVRKAGNRAVHEGKVTEKEAVKVLEELHFVVGELCVFLGLVTAYPQFQKDSLNNKSSSLPMSPVELEISQSFVAQLHKQLANHPTYSQKRQLINVHVNTRKPDTAKKPDTGANTKTAFQDVAAYLVKAFPDVVHLPDRTKCVVTLKAASGKTVVVSVKSGCSQLSATVNGEMQLLPNIDIILYAPDFALGNDVLSQLHVFTKEEFLTMWNTLGLIRKKVSTSALNHYRELYGPDFKTDIEQHADVISVQSFSNSGIKSKLVQNACDEKPCFLTSGVDTIRSFLQN